MSDRNASVRNFISGLLIGSALGGLIALLYAPTSGKKLRRKIGDKTEEIFEEAEEIYQASKEKTEGLIKEGKKLATNLVNDAKKIVHN